MLYLSLLRILCRQWAADIDGRRWAKYLILGFGGGEKKHDYR
jgi:hypothetical protein